MKFLKLPILLTAIFSISACDLLDEDSNEVETKDFYTEIEVLSNSEGSAKVEVKINKKDDRGKNITLSNGEKLTVIFEDNSVQLSQERGDALINKVYTGTIATTGESGEVSVVLTRADGSELISTVMMPDLFSVTNPAGGSRVSEGDSFNVTWAPDSPSNKINIFSRLTCSTLDDDFDINRTSGSQSNLVVDNGIYDVPLFSLHGSMALNTSLRDDVLIEAEPCDLVIELEGTNQGNISSGFAPNSHIRGKQQRNLNMTYLLL